MNATQGTIFTAIVVIILLALPTIKWIYEYFQNQPPKQYATKRAGDINKFTLKTPDKSPRSTERIQ